MSAERSVKEPSISIPSVDPKRINNSVLKKVEIIAASLSATRNLSKEEELIKVRYGIPAWKQRRWKKQLRRLYSLPERAPLFPIAHHPQLREALTCVIVRKPPADRGTLRSGSRLMVAEGEGKGKRLIPLIDFVSDTYLKEGRNAAATYRRLQELCKRGSILKIPEMLPCFEGELPKRGSIRRFVRRKHPRTISPEVDKVLESALERGQAELVESVIDACKQIHEELGHKQREVIYHRAIEFEFQSRSIPYVHEAESPVPYKGKVILGNERVDFLIGGNLILEIKAKKELLREDMRQARSYLKNLAKQECLLVNFGSQQLQVLKYFS
jgi:GxxExxY protein